jgi:chorismate synthase
MTGTLLRPLTSQADYRACVALQRATWGSDFQEVVPPTILWVTQRLGGVVAGAFEGERLVGFVFGMTGTENGRLVHWSDMLAVAEDARGRGIGRMLKAYQRETLLPLGVELVYWTFDPLEARNAHINFVRLGITARRYLRDVYGDGTSTLHVGLGTDRLLAEWWIASERVAERMEGRLGGEAVRRQTGEPVGSDRPASGPVEARLEEAALAADGDAPGEPRLALDAPAVTIAVPADVQQLKQRDPVLARTWRGATRAAFESYLARGDEFVDFVRRGAAGDYVLRRRADGD